MREGYLSLINEIINSSNNLPVEKLPLLIEETLSLFRDLKAKYASKDAEAVGQAVQETAELKVVLEAKIGELCSRIGIDPSQISTLFEDPSRFSGEELRLVEDTQSHLDEIQKGDRHPHRLRQILR